MSTDRTGGAGANPAPSVLETATRYVAAGYSVIPLRLKSKRPAIDWKPFQSRRPIADELESWWGAGSSAGVAS